MSQIYCILDYETRSKAELKKTGAYEYAAHPSTQILCVAWRIGTWEELQARKGETRVWSPALPGPYGELKKALLNPHVLLVAHNVPFEKAVTKFVLSKLIHDEGIRNIDPSRWICTMSMAAALAFPRKLEAVCAALNLPVQKDMEGHRLMMKMSKPRRPTKKNPAVWHQKKSDLLRLMEYCKTDINAEIELFLTLPKLSPEERKTWELDQKINDRGFHCDRPLIEKILNMIDQEMSQLRERTSKLTNGVIESTSQRDATLRWLEENGVILFNLQKKTVADALESGMASGKAREMLALRLAASKSSTAKYEAFRCRSESDGRIRHSMVYHAASTGRWGGAGVQPQNFPQGSVKDTDLACRILADPDTDLETIRMLYGNPLDFFSSLLRAMIIPSSGCELFGGDFSGIEVRVLFWVAKHEDGLEAYREGRDLYREIATKIYDKPLDAITKPEREVGKRAILGCGFGMGRDKFFETCKLYGQEIEPELAKMAVEAYRTTHEAVPKLWKNLEKAAIAAVKAKGKKKYKANRTAWWMQGKYLYCTLPSGRRLAYYGPQVKTITTSWGEDRPALYHWDIHPKTKKWVFVPTYGGKLTENVVQGTARDVLRDAMHRVEEAGYKLLITVHDEPLTEKPIGEGSVSEFEKLMNIVPPWADNLPIKTECYKAARYRK